ncbi:VOC family protein [Lentzea sp. NPDC058450]|uniref:VOC family protein n=1 Tax=Lentzea sp. NPDC058450 TaxID=3346505 RepID=UPI00365B27AF
MRIHHVCVTVSDLDRSLPFYQDLLGFKDIVLDTTLPGELFDAATLDDIVGTENAATRVVLVADESGTVLELQQASHPRTVRTPDEYLGFGASGLRVLALAVTGIEEFFQRVKDAGCRTQTDYIMSAMPGHQTFMFYDPDGTLIQVVED